MHGDWMVFNRRSFVWTDNALWQCPLPRISWSDRFLGGCIRYAAGWPGYPERRRHPGDYAGTRARHTPAATLSLHGATTPSSSHWELAAPLALSSSL